MNNSKNEIVEKMVKEMRENLFSKYYDEERLFEKIYINIDFIKKIIEKDGIEKTVLAGLTLLRELGEKKQAHLLDSEICGKPKIALGELFKKAIKEGHEKEIAEAVVEMYKRGNKNGLFLFEILEETVTERSIPSLKKLSNEMNKRTRASIQGDNKKRFIQKNKTEIQNLINKFKTRQLPFSHSQLNIG